MYLKQTNQLICTDINFSYFFMLLEAFIDRSLKIMLLTVVCCHTAKQLGSLPCYRFFWVSSRYTRKFTPCFEC